MNTCIETLNHWGENALAFAGPMLWQSSLLIVVVFALDYLLACRVRAAVRHALWMVVLIKLLLPPALALPTGATWWLWPAKPPLTPVFKNETVTFDTSPLPDNFVPPTVPIALPPPKLSGAGWAMLASGMMSAGLLFSLLFQWLKVERKTRHPRTPATASGDFSDALEQARQLAGLRKPMRLRLVDDAMSPAVYGLFRPVILLPRALAEKLSAAQLRAVLLHEAIHLRRGDVRVNCAQTLLQIAYWWHPLLWMANARIRRLREEAVDDAVMVALRGDAEAYAPTLLEVAKFAFRRPLASLGLVGILESRSALRQRVERLVDFQAPRRTGVTFLSLFSIFLFGAVMLPMGQAPAITTGPNGGISLLEPGIYALVNTPSSITPAGVTNKIMPGFNPLGTPLEMRTFKVDTNIFLANLHEEIDFQTNVSEALKDVFSKAGVKLDPPKTLFFKERPQGGILFVYATPGDLKLIERAIMELNDPRTPFRNVTRSSSEAERKPAADAWVQVGKEFYKAGKLDDARQDFDEALVLDPDNHDATYYLNLISQAKAVLQSWPGSANAKHAPYLLAKPGSGSGDFTETAFDPAVIRSSYQQVSAPVNPADLQTNYFPINVAAFKAAVLKETGEPDAIEGFKELALKAGVDLSPPTQAFIASERFGVLHVVETRKDLPIIGGVLDSLHCLAPQIHIKARFIEVPKTFFADERDSIPAGATNGGVLTYLQFRKFLDQLQSQKDSRELAEPEVTTIAGRQTQIRATVLQDVVTNYLFDPGSPYHRNATITAQTAKVETGPILDSLAMVLPDGYTIALTATPAIIKFYGYADPRGLTPSYGTNSDGQKIPLPFALPVFGVGEVTEQKALYDGQTVVLLPRPRIEYNGGMEEKYRDRIEQHIQEAQKKEGNWTLIVLVTVTLIDDAGNRFHSDADMAFAKNKVPQQPVIWSNVVP